MADVPGDVTTGATISVGATITEAIEVLGDHDWFRISLTAGQKVTIAVNLVSLEDSYIYLRNASGEVLVENDDGGGGRGSRIVYTAPTTGIYYIDASAWVNDGTDTDYTGTGSYKLSVTNYVMPTVGTLDEFAFQMTHGFFGGDSHHFDVTQGGTITVNVTALTDAGREVALQALQQWTDIIGVNFVQVTGTAQITFDDLDAGTTGAFANTVHANGITTSATVNIAISRINLHTYMHEIGHALGIGHTSNSNAGTAAAIYPDDAIWSNDGAAISIMSYFDNGENGYYSSQGFSNVAIMTPQVADIIAMGNLYGLSTTTRVGDTIYGFNTNTSWMGFDATQKPNVSYTIFDSGGIDTLDYSGFAANQLINLNPEAFSNIGSLVGNVVIARGTVIENATGGSGADTLIGNAVANVLRGNAGSDTLTGGAGGDSFVGTRAQLSGDTITDFGAGDKIVFTDATSGNFTFSLNGGTLTFTGGSMTLTGASGTLFASAAAGGGIQLAFAQAVVRDVANDFNGDGRSDILWRNDGTGQVTDWLGQTNGGFANNAANFHSQPGLDWQVVSTGDYNGDGKDDILWRNVNTSQITDWLGQANGSFASNSGNLDARPGLDWQVAASGDFNGDGKDDILWRNSGTGQVIDWLGQANGGFVSNSGNFDARPGLDWQVAASGDFNGDGKDDILWRNSGTGQVIDWLGQANGSFASNVGNFDARPGLDWKIVGTGDFNGDGKDDILWRNSGTGQITDWLGQANGGFASNFANLDSKPGLDWHVAGIGDYNGDGKDDILWRNDGGTLLDWLGTGNGSFTSNSGASTNTVDTGWQVQSHDILFV